MLSYLSVKGLVVWDTPRIGVIKIHLSPQAMRSGSFKGGDRAKTDRSQVHEFAFETARSAQEEAVGTLLKLDGAGFSCGKGVEASSAGDLPLERPEIRFQ